MLGIIKNVVVTNIRSNKFVLFNMFFPILLMVMIGGMLQDSFSSSKDIGEVEITYYNDGNDQSNIILDVIKNSDLGMDVSIKEVESIEDGKHSARLKESVFIHLNKEDIDVYANDYSSIDNYVVNSILNSINNQIHLNDILVNNNSDINTEVKSNIEDNIKIEKLPAKESISSYDYYSVVHLTMMTMYISLFAIYTMRNEREYKLKQRINMAGISNTKYYIGNFIGYTVLGAICTTPGYLFALFVLKANLGQYPILPYILMITLIMMFSGMSMLIEVIFKDTYKVTSVLQGIVFPIMSFLGGCYISLPDNVGGIFQVLTNISPIRWANRAIFRLNFGQDSSLYISCVTVNIVVCLIFIIGTLLIESKEEKLS